MVIDQEEALRITVAELADGLSHYRRRASKLHEEAKKVPTLEAALAQKTEETRLLGDKLTAVRAELRQSDDALVTATRKCTDFGIQVQEMEADLRKTYAEVTRQNHHLQKDGEQIAQLTKELEQVRPGGPHAEVVAENKQLNWEVENLYASKSRAEARIRSLLRKLKALEKKK